MCLCVPFLPRSIEDLVQVRKENEIAEQLIVQKDNTEREFLIDTKKNDEVSRVEHKYRAVAFRE